MKFPVGSVWRFSHTWSADVVRVFDTEEVDEYVEVFIVVGDIDPEDGSPATFILIIDDPKFPHREGHIMSFVPPGNYWELSQRIS